MNRTFILATLLSLNWLNASAQSPTTNPKGPVNTANPRSYYDPGDTAVENRLVELALKGPEYKASNHQIIINELELKRTKNSWFNLLTVSTNYNDQSFAKQAAQANYVYPKYFFGLTIPLGVIFSQGNQIKTAKESVLYSKDLQDGLARRIKADVLSKYKQYKLYSSLIEIQSELINDVVAHASKAEENFKNGTISVEEYITAQKIRNEELAKNLNLKLQQELVQLEIEKMIGIPFEEVLKPTPTTVPKSTKSKISR